MKKNLLWMFAAILFCGAMTTSCDKDDEDNNNGGQQPPQSATFAKVKINYTVTALQSMFNALNVKVNYVKSDKNTDRETLTTTNWDKSIEIPASSMPCTVTMKMVFTPLDANSVSSNLVTGYTKTMKVSTFDSNGREIVSKTRDTKAYTIEVEDGIEMKTVAKTLNSAEIELSLNVDEDGNVYD